MFMALEKFPLVIPCRIYLTVIRDSQGRYKASIYLKFHARGREGGKDWTQSSPTESVGHVNKFPLLSGLQKRARKQFQNRKDKKK